MSERDTTIPATAALLRGWIPKGYLVEMGWLVLGKGLDLTIPAVRDRVVRVMAEALGVPVGATAPGWFRTTSTGDWVLVGEAASYTSFGKSADECDHAIPGISEVTDPIVSLALAWRAVCGENGD